VVTGQVRKAITPFQTWNSLITDEILDNTIQHRNSYSLIIQANNSHKNDNKHIDKIEINGFIGLLSLGGVFQSNKKSLEELWRTDGDGIEKFCLVMNHSCFKFLILCFLE
jgi:hypothetical protein